jgi:signal transduction histidine kinase
MRSIGLKLWAGMMILVMLMLILLWSFQIAFLERFYTRMRIGEVKNKAYSIIEKISYPVNNDIGNEIEAFTYNNNLSIEILDSRGNLVLESTAGAAGHMPMMFNSSRVEAFNEALEYKEALFSLIHPRFGNKFMLIGLPIVLSGQVEGVFLINMPLAPVEATTSILKKQLIYISGFLLAAALIISFLMARSFTKPILQITRLSEKMASGDFSHRIEVKSRDEIGKLAEAINYMGKEISKIEQLRKDFIANVSHELRTPLSLIRGYAETLRDVTGNVQGKRQKQLGIIIEESERLSRIVDDVLNLSQMQAGYINFEMKTFSISDLIERGAKRYDILSEKTGVGISTSTRMEFTVKADEKRIEQVLYNLINNAFNYTKSGGYITVELSDNIDSVRIEVRDTGSGIPKEELKHIWDRYYKADKKSGNQVAGTGLGLAIVKNILEVHSAPYGVESTINVGTTFWFELKKQ